MLLMRNIFNSAIEMSQFCCIMDKNDGEKWKVRILHSDELLLSAVAVYDKTDRLLAVSHLIGPDCLPSRHQLDSNLVRLCSLKQILAKTLRYVIACLTHAWAWKGNLRPSPPWKACYREPCSTPCSTLLIISFFLRFSLWTSIFEHFLTSMLWKSSTAITPCSTLFTRGLGRRFLINDCPFILQKSVPSLTSTDERAMVVHNRAGDFAVIKARWEGFRNQILSPTCSFFSFLTPFMTVKAVAHIIVPDSRIRKWQMSWTSLVNRFDFKSFWSWNHRTSIFAVFRMTFRYTCTEHTWKFNLFEDNDSGRRGYAGSMNESRAVYDIATGTTHLQINSPIAFQGMRSIKVLHDENHLEIIWRIEQLSLGMEQRC